MVMGSIIKTIPREAYKYIGNGYEQDGKLNLMIVMEDGCDAEELMKSPLAPPSDETLAAVAREVCSQGVWPCFDGASIRQTMGI
jgi:hypothetical protein